MASAAAEPEVVAEVPEDQPREGSRAGDRVVLKSRFKRFADLRSAQRVLAVIAPRDHEEIQERTGALRQALTQIARLEGSDEEISQAIRDSLPALDEQLEVLAGDLGRLVEQVSFPQLRSTIPQLAGTHRHDVIAVLNLLLENRATLAKNLFRVEYLITLLASEQNGTRRRIVHDPPQISPMLARLCEELENERPPEATGAELMFFQAAALDAALDTDSGARINELRHMRQSKQELGIFCLVPGVLRALVTYNTRIFNKMQGELEESRDADIEFELLFLDQDFADEDESLEDSDKDWVSEFEEGIGRASTLSVFESKGVGRIAEALRRRLAGVPIGSCASENIALSIELFDLEPIERAALMDASSHAEGKLIACTLIVGALNQDYPAYRQVLQELEIEEQDVRGTWVSELDGLLQAAIAKRIVSPDQYEDATFLSNLKSKCLYSALSLLAQKSRDERGPLRARGDEQHATLEMQEAAQAAAAESSTGSVRVHSSDSESQVHDERVAKAKQSVLRRAATAVGAVTILATLASNLIVREPTDVAILRPIVLAQISEYLTTGYRDKAGRGTQFIGRIDQDWVKLAAAEKRRTAAEMIERLKGEGVTQVLVYDDRLRLQVHFAGNKIRLPKPVKSAPAS